MVKCNVVIQRADGETRFFIRLSPKRTITEEKILNVIVFTFVVLLQRKQTALKTSKCRHLQTNKQTNALIIASEQL